MQSAEERPIPLTRRPMRLINAETGLMRCIVCGAEHHANLQSGGRYEKGSFTCPNDNCPTRESRAA